MTKYKKIVNYFKNRKLYFYENKYNKSGKFKKMDDEFYAQFDNMYYNGIPIYYYLQKMSMNRCYDASAVLALALGENCNVCRGILDNAVLSSGKEFVHGWVEMDDKVYDTTWQIIADKKAYYKTFGAKAREVTPQKEFFERSKHISNWKIHDKEYYENGEGSLSTLMISQIEQLQMAILMHPSTDYAEREFSKKVLADLPDTSKVKLKMPDLNNSDFSRLSGNYIFEEENNL